MQGRQRYLKLVGFWVGFLILHYAYEFVPILPFKILGGIDESFFQHAKMAFFTYGIVSLVEYGIRRTHGGDLEGFIFSRLFSTTILPWFVFIIWFIAPVYYGRIPNVVIEIVYANVALILAGICALIVEQAMESMIYTRSLKVVIVTLLVVSLSLFVICTFRLPWVDVFADPHG
jgi:hypothetical protein